MVWEVFFVRKWKMRKVTAIEVFVPFVVGIAGLFAMNLAALKYPDSSEYINYGLLALTIASLIVAVFFLERARKKRT